MTTEHERQREAQRDRRSRARKEKVLHTRISEDLAEDIRRMADELRVPVSNIVRNVLEEAFSVVEKVTDNVGDLIEDVVDEAEAARDRLRERQRRRRRSGAERPGTDVDEVETETAPPRDFPDVIGWQPVLVERSQQCSVCGAVIERGEQSFVGVTSAGLGGEFLCEACMGARR